MNQGIGWAVKEITDGGNVRRMGWGVGMFLFHVPAGHHSSPQVEGPALQYIALRTSIGTVLPWTCTQADLFACDWQAAKA